MPRLLVFQHVAHEILGTLDPLLRSYGFRNRYVNFERECEARPKLDGYHGLVVLGGPMNVDETDAYPHLDTEVEVIRTALERELPILGICLGAQLVARALGAPVSRSPVKEIGWYEVSLTQEGREDPLFQAFGESETLFQWHGDTFAIPPGAVHLATSPDCRNQAFRYGDRVYGLQFHLEVDEPMVERWLSVPANQDEIASLGGAVCPEEIRRMTPRHAPRLRVLADACYGAFARLFGSRRRRSVLPHR